MSRKMSSFLNVLFTCIPRVYLDAQRIHQYTFACTLTLSCKQSSSYGIPTMVPSSLIYGNLVSAIFFTLRYHRRLLSCINGLFQFPDFIVFPYTLSG